MKADLAGSTCEDVLAILARHGQHLPDELQRQTFIDSVPELFSLSAHLSQRWRTLVTTSAERNEPLSAVDTLAAVAASLPPPRNHGERKIIHQTARALGLSVEDVIELSQEHPTLALLEPALPTRMKSTPTTTSNPVVQERSGPEMVMRMRYGAAFLVALAVLTLTMAFGVPEQLVDVADEGVIRICTGERAAPRPGSPDALNRLGPISLERDQAYTLTITVHRQGLRTVPNGASAIDTDTRLAILPRGSSRAIPVQPLTSSHQGLQRVHFDVASFVAPRTGAYWILLEVRCRGQSLSHRGTCRVTSHPWEGTGTPIAIGGLLCLVVGLLLGAASFNQKQV